MDVNVAEARARSGERVATGVAGTGARSARRPEEGGRRTRPSRADVPGAGKSPAECQAAFFARIGGVEQLYALFSYLPDVDFFAKDADGRFVAMGPGTLRRIGLEHEAQVIGATDEDIHPPNVARAIRQDDYQVMRTRQPLVDRVEALFARTHAKDWFLTTKLPILDTAGEVIGIMGFVRPYRAGSPGCGEGAQIERVVAYIHAHYAGRLSISDLARLAHLSERQVNRRFQDTFHMSAQEFIVRTRIQAASDALLATDLPLVEIALTHGFYDQSAFCRQFRQHVGETPLAFRRRRAGLRSPRN